MHWPMEYNYSKSIGRLHVHPTPIVSYYTVNIVTSVGKINQVQVVYFENLCHRFKQMYLQYV